MEVIHGKESCLLDGPALAGRLRGYRRVLLDLGTGDGRYALQAARQDPATFAIGVDACRENLRAPSRAAPPNALFVIANALDLPPDLRGVAGRIAINFPWGSLLAGLLAGDPALLDGLRALAHPDTGASLELRLNEGALVEAGSSLAEGGAQAKRVLRAAGFAIDGVTKLGIGDLRAFPSSWARRLAHGPRPRALELRATISAAPSPPHVVRPPLPCEERGEAGGGSVIPEKRCPVTALAPLPTGV